MLNGELHMTFKNNKNLHMKRIAIYSLVLLFISCAGTTNSTPSSVAEIVAESFYQGKEAMLKKHTTPKVLPHFPTFKKCLPNLKVQNLILSLSMKLLKAMSLG